MQAAAFLTACKKQLQQIYKIFISLILGLKHPSEVLS